VKNQIVRRSQLVNSLRQKSSSICTLNGQFSIQLTGVLPLFNCFLMHPSVDAVCIFISGLWHLLHTANGLFSFVENYKLPDGNAVAQNQQISGGVFRGHLHHNFQ
jgi:hypothetical protein